MKNPLFKSGIKSGTHHLGGVGEIKRIRLRDIHSPQQTVDEKKVRELARFTKNMPGTPTASHVGGGKYVLKDGNHRVNAALRQGKRVIDVRVQKLAAKINPIQLGVRWEKAIRAMPPEKAEVAIRTIARTIRPLKGGFVGDYTPSQRLLTRALYPKKIENLPEALVRTKESLRDARIAGDNWNISTGKKLKDRALMKRGAKPSFAEARGLDPEEEVGIIHGGGEAHIRDFIAGKSRGYKLEGDRRTGIQVHPINAMGGAQLRDRTRFYANRASGMAYDNPAMLTGTVKRKHLVTANNSYEGAVVDPTHISRPKVRPLKRTEDRPSGKYWAEETASKIGTTEPIRKYVIKREQRLSSPSPLIQFMHCTAEAVPRADIPRKIVKRKIIKKPIQFAAFDMYRTWMDPIDKSSPGRKDRRALQDAAGRSVDLPASKPPRVPSGGIGRSLSQERIEKKIQQGAAREVADQMEGIRDHPGVGAPSTEGELARHKKSMQGPELYHPENEVKGSVIHTRSKPAPVEAWKHRDPRAWLVANQAQGRHADLDPENMTDMQKVSMRKEAQTFRDAEAKTLRNLRGRIQEMRKAVSPGFKPSENFKPSSVSNNIVGGMKPEKWEPKGRLRIGPGLSTPEMVHGAISYVNQKAGDRISTVKSRLRRMEGTLKTRVGETTGMPEGPARHAKVKGYLEGMISSEGPTAMDLTKKIDPTRSERIQKAMSRPGREWNPERVERSRRAIAKLEHQANSAEYLSQVRQGVVKKMVAAPKVSALPDGYVPGAALKKLGRIAGATALVGAGAYGIRKYLNRSKEEPKQLKMSARGRIIQFVVPRQVKQIRKAILTAREPAKRWRASAFADHVMSESEKRGGTAQRFFPNLYSNLPPKAYKLHGRPVDAQRMAREQSRAGHEEKLVQRLVEQGKIVRTGKPIPKEAFTNYPVNAIGKLPTVEEVMSQDIVGDVSSRVSNQFAKHAGAARAVVAEERRMPLAIIQHTPSPLADKIAATERRAVEAEGLVGGLRASVASSKKAAAESTSRHAEEMKRQVFRGDRNLLIGAGAAGAAGIGGGYLIGRKKKEVQFSEKKRELTPWQKVGISAAASGAVLGAIPAFRHGSTFRGVAKSIGTGAGIGSIIGGGGTYVGTKILGEPRKDDPIGTTKRAAVGGAIAGLGLGAAGAIALRRGHFKNAMQDWRPVTFIRRTAAPVAIATGAGAGALIAGSHAADEGQQVDTMRNLKKSIRMSSKLKPIRFAIEAPLSGKLAADRYRKKIADDDFDRRDANVLRSSGAGAVLGGMLGGRRGALAGAGLGAASVLGIRQATKSGKDMYGERSRGAKQAEGLPWKIAAIGAAGLSGRSIYNKLKSLRGTTLSRKGGLIEFRDWSDKWVGDNVNYTARGEDVNRWGGRGGRLVRDIGRKARGEEHKDSRGRVQTPEWQKPWTKKAMLIGGVGLALGAGVLTRGKLKGLAQEAKASYGVNQVPRPAARFAHNVMEGNVSHSVKNRIGAFVPGPVKRGYQKVKGFFSNVARDVEHKAASKLDKINEAVENESNMVVTAKGKIHNARKVNAAVAEQEKALNQANVIAGNAKEKIRLMRSPEELAAEETLNTIYGKPRTFSSNEKPIRFDAWDIKERSRNTAIVRTSDYNKTRKEREHTRMSKSTGYLLRDLGIAAAGGIGLWAGHRRGFAKAAGTRPSISPAARVMEEAPPQMWIREPIQAYQSMSQIIHLNNQLDNLLT